MQPVGRHQAGRFPRVYASSFSRCARPARSAATGSAVWWNAQKPSGMPFGRYRDVFARVRVPEVARRWPDNRLVAAPLWVPVDLRDGNQALAGPMGPERKRRFFDVMVRLGYKEIEVGYPSASQMDFDFVRELAEPGRVPEDVAVVVFTPAREDLIDRTFAAVAGMSNVVVHMYTATAPVWRDVVLRAGRDELRERIRAAGEHVARCADDRPGVRFEFSPEVFNLTEPDFALEVCDTMTKLWEASADRPVIVNLPATVEVATPDVYADLVTLALNLYAQGIDPMIDFSDIDGVRETVEHCNRIPVHPRHPYVGEYVHTAFSGTHQDAINKGFARHRRDAAAAGVSEAEASWKVPYLPIDPNDIGRSYEAVIRINS